MTKHDVYGPTCSAEGCGSDHKTHGYCGMHWMRVQRYGSTDGPDPALIQHGNRTYENRCMVDTCERPHKTQGYCSMHYQRVKRLGEPGPVGRIVRGRYKDSNGYIVVRKEGNHKILEHRLLMEQHLGRELVDRENVHHMNGVRDDNRLENLELWVKPQPQGQRVHDLVAWVVAAYPDEVKRALLAREEHAHAAHVG